MSPSCAVQHEWLKKDNLRYGYGYAYILTESNNLCVTDWGRPSMHEFVQQEKGVEGVWIVYWVSVYTRNFQGIRHSFPCGDRGWLLWTCYPVKTFNEMEQLFLRYLGTGGLYSRVCYHVEKWEWSEATGWQPADYV